jgi:hypothetical protein
MRVEPHVSPQFRTLGIQLRNSSAKTDSTLSQLQEHKMEVFNEMVEVHNKNYFHK